MNEIRKKSSDCLTSLLNTILPVWETEGNANVTIYIVECFARV